MAHHPFRVGLPRALPYYKYAPLWNHFLRELGCEVVTSPETNRRILEKGCRHAIDENCLAMKIYLGHVEALLGKVDYILIPRLASLYPREEMCVKFYSLGDVVRSTFNGVRVLEYTIDVTNHQYEWRGFFEVGRQLTNNPFSVWRAYRSARQQLHDHKANALRHQLEKLGRDSSGKTRVLMVAHSYVIHDALMGKTVERLLRGLDVEVVYADVVDVPQARQLSRHLSTDLYWSYHKELLGGIEQYKGAVDGIVFVVAFPCGPDALIVQLCQHRLENIPLCILNLDELQGDAGLKTRLESFIDILRLKKERVI